MSPHADAHRPGQRTGKQPWKNLSRLWGPLLVALFALPAIQPLLGPTLPRGADSLLHLHRLIQLDRLLRQGVLYSRWSPDLVYGYGLPLFNFYAPLAYYLPEAMHLLGLSLVVAFKAAFLLALVGSGLTMYLFASDVFGPKGGVLAGVAYLYAPYLLYDTLFRGSLPDVLALMLFPLIGWAFHRLVRLAQARYLLLSTLSYAALLLTHNLSALLFTPLLIAYVLWLMLCPARAPHPSGPRPVAPSKAMPLAALALAFGLSAFFWLPAIAEKGYIHVERGLMPPDFDYHQHFTPLAEVLSPPQPMDTGRMNPTLPHQLGLIQLALAGFAIAAFNKLPSRDARRHAAFFALAVMGTVFMMLPQSVWVWERLPWLAYAQFPYRFLGPASFAVAFLSGGAAHFRLGDVVRRAGLLPATRRRVTERSRRGWGGAGIPLTMAALVVAGLPLLYPHRYGSLPPNPSLAEAMEWEHRTGTIGTTSSGEYLPVWVEWLPTDSPLEAQYRNGTPLDRLDTAGWPDGAELLAAEFGPLSARVSIRTDQPLRATFFTHYYPGWQATLDGQPVPIEPTAGQGRISVAVPPGEHTLRLRFGETPLRRLADGLSALSVVGLLMGVVYAARRRHQAAIPPAGELAPCFVALAAGLAVVLLALKIGYVDGHDTPLKWDFDGQTVRGVQTPLAIDFGGDITLLGYDLSASTVRDGDTLRLDLYWKAQHPLPTVLSSLAHVIDPDFNIYAQQDNIHPGNHPTPLWEPDKYVKDTHRLTIPPATPPGDYPIEIGIFDPNSGQRLPVLTESEGNRGEVFVLPPITIVPSGKKWSREQLGIQHPVDAAWANGMVLWGYETQKATLPRGGFLRLTLFWHTPQPPCGDYAVGLRLSSAGGEPVVERMVQPSNGRYPTGRWAAGETVRDNHALWLPADLPDGTYRLELWLAAPGGGEVPLVAGGTGNRLTLGELSTAP